MRLELPDEVRRDPLSWPALDWAMGTSERTFAYANNLVVNLRLPAQPVPTVRMAVHNLIRLHPTLRTSYLHLPGSAGVQILREAPDPSQPTALLNVRDVKPAELFEEEDPHSFDLDHELPFTVVAAVGDRSELGLRLTVDHIATDWHGIEILAADLSALLAGRQPGGSGLTPQDLAGWESSHAGAQWNQRKAGLWRSVLDAINAQGDGRGMGSLGPTPRQSANPLLEHELFCPGLGAPITALAGRCGTYVSAVVLSCLAAAHREVFGQTLFVAQALSTNRWSRRGKRSSAKLLMQGPVVLQAARLEPDRVDQLRAAHRSLFRAMSMAYLNPAGVPELIRERQLSTVPGVLGAYYNFNVVEPPAATTGRLATLVHRSGAGQGPGIAYTVHHSSEHLMVGLRHAPETMTAEQAGEVLRCVHRLVCQQATGRSSELEDEC